MLSLQAPGYCSSARKLTEHWLSRFSLLIAVLLSLEVSVIDQSPRQFGTDIGTRESPASPKQPAVRLVSARASKSRTDSFFNLAKRKSNRRARRAGTPFDSGVTDPNSFKRAIFSGSAAIPLPQSFSATVPAGAATGKISVTNTAGTGTSATNLTVTPANISVAISPNRGGLTVGQALPFTAAVTNDVGNAGVTWSASSGSFST